MARRGYSLLPASHFRGVSDSKESAYNAGSKPGLERCPGDGMEPALVFLPGESHGQRGLEGYSSQGHTESDTTEVTKLRQQQGGDGA